MMPDHGGTHIDAPRHFSIDGTPINEYPLENCIVKGICIDLRHIEPKSEITCPQIWTKPLKKQANRFQKMELTTLYRPPRKDFPISCLFNR